MSMGLWIKTSERPFRYRSGEIWNPSTDSGAISPQIVVGFVQDLTASTSVVDT